MNIKVKRKITKSILPVALLACTMQISQAMDTYNESGGLVVMETENTTSPLGQWIRIEPGDPNYVSGATGGAHLEFTGNTFNGGPPNSPLVYKFKVNQGGNYYLHLRARKRLEGQPGDKSNDAYVRMAGDFTSGSTFYPTSTLTQDTKLFGGLENSWGWATNLDGNGAPHKPAIYNLKAGETYTFTVSGRSIRFNIDRIIFKHSSITDGAARNPSVPESGLVSDTPPPPPPTSDVNFQFNGNSDEGWARSSSIEAYAFTVNGEYLVRAAPNSDPFIFNNGFSFSGSDTTEIRVRMKAQASGVIQLFWGTSQAGAGGFSANRVKSVSYPTANVYQELVFDMSGESAWVGKTITDLRVDTTTASTPSHTWFDYIVGNDNSFGFVFLRKRSAIGFAMDGGAGGQNNQNVNMQGYNTSDLGQQWEEISRGNSFYTYKKRNTNFVLDGGAGLASNGDNVYLWSEGATNQNQHWKKINVGGGYYRLEKRNANTHSIDGGGGAGFNGQNVKLWVNGNSNQNQHWRIE